MLPDQKKEEEEETKPRHKWNKSPHCLSKDCNDSRGTWLLRRRNKWYSFLLHCKLISQTQLFLRLRLKILSNIERPLTACRMSTEKHWSCLLRAHLQVQVFLFVCLFWNEAFFEALWFPLSHGHARFSQCHSCDGEKAGTDTSFYPLEQKRKGKKRMFI